MPAPFGPITATLLLSRAATFTSASRKFRTAPSSSAGGGGLLLLLAAPPPPPAAPYLKATSVSLQMCFSLLLMPSSRPGVGNLRRGGCVSVRVQGSRSDGTNKTKQGNPFFDGSEGPSQSARPHSDWPRRTHPHIHTCKHVCPTSQCMPETLSRPHPVLAGYGRWRVAARHHPPKTLKNLFT